MHVSLTLQFGGVGMAQTGNQRIIIKRKKVVAGGGHHGGAWKVAYADFVTAMMAFFLLMWIINSITEEQRDGLANFFATGTPVSTVSGGADGMFGGRDSQSQQVGPAVGSGMDYITGRMPTARGASAAQSSDILALEDIARVLSGQSGESLVDDAIQRHIITRMTDEGLVIEVFSTPDAPVFQPGGTVLTPLSLAIIQMIASVAAQVENGIAVAAHLPQQAGTDQGAWALTAARADTIRAALEGAGVAPVRLRRVTGHADRSPITLDPTVQRNDRVEITVLRNGR
ncbi:OmpA/MotB [Ketogulonicigenium vulgare Y25]|uniref:Flagellar motor protein-like protein n=2 Tax=Ketogulonicigenium vulgare TaxID=92945 RepID=F9Y4I2_KETVW|nr:OmpA/MotB [Ketogulonicigenium vulgare Y25]AEM41795.1 Flagellar motor protein-like protein [Ketogulonicigenium vulgare WSH-001]ALJ81901.1 flagellar motor protein [Ketogulonicigenium vulgare]ANW34550.1 flagellar motor protein [Ketogulonicigenium vulgare]AOZ55552.1 OmpA/MotB [Ketogulonicigenium vulgare]